MTNEWRGIPDAGAGPRLAEMIAVTKREIASAFGLPPPATMAGLRRRMEAAMAKLLEQNLRTVFGSVPVAEPQTCKCRIVHTCGRPFS